jgi:signal transduction histidine kinase
VSGSTFKLLRFFRLWEQNPREAMNKLVEQIKSLGLFEPEIVEYKAGDVILSENARNKSLFILLDGMVHLFKDEVANRKLPVTEIMPGGMFGVLSFFSRKRALTSAVAEIKCKVLKLSAQQVDMILNSDTILAGMGRQLLISNLMQRYEQVVQLNVQLKTTNKALDTEKKRLSNTLDELDAAHRRLVHQEKMATLGQLVAGVAHEINNPASALANAVDYLTAKLPELFKEGGQADTKFTFFEQGLTVAIISTSEQRTKIASLSKAFDGLKDSIRRKLVYLDGSLLEVAENYARNNRMDQLELHLSYLETGMQLRSIRLTSGRIAGLVKSLKRYSRHESTHIGTVDIREGIQDTLQILGNRLKEIEVEVSFAENLPFINADPAELNQVWTNLIVNACDALNNRGRIYIRCTFDSQCLFIKIGDDGKGIPEHLRDVVFKPHFTTRNSSGNFGLGLGLSISRELIMKNGGTITVSKSSYDGAEMIVMLPISTE